MSTTTASTLPSLRAGHGLPGRHAVLCDGRTSLRLSQQLDGFDNLVHYAPDSWYALSRHVLHADGQAMVWQVDGAPHRFEWVELFPFGYTNREDRPTGPVTSRGLVTQGAVLWTLDGLSRDAALHVPRAMFHDYNQRDAAGTALEVAHWAFPTPSSAPVAAWSAMRREQWRFRDSSTYASFVGKTIAPEDRTSTLHLCLLSHAPMQITQTDGVWQFVIPARAGAVALAIGLGANAAEATACAEQLLRDPAAAWNAQRVRYTAVARETPQLEFGRHTALRQFFRIQPGYLESLRIREQPGAFRANNDYYWVWSWDMTRPAFGILTSNRHTFARQLLDFLDAGYINQYDNTLTRDLRVGGGTGEGGEPGALEYLLAHDYLAWTGDLEATRAWQKNYEAALRKVAAHPDPTGMWPGAAASTDFPEEFGRTFPAWLAYSMSWHYVGLLSAEKLLLAWGNPDLATAVRAQALKIRNNFLRVFWNDQTGFWNEGVHPSDPDLVCDIPLSTALAGMDSPYGEDLYADKLAASAAFARDHFLRADGVHITARGECRGWKEWTRQPNNWFAANDTMLARLFRAVGDAESLEKLFYLYELNFGYQPCAFEGKPFRRPLHTSGSWQAFGAGAWYRNLVECAAGLWADLGGLTLVPCGLGEPVRLSGLKYRHATLEFTATSQGRWPQQLELDGHPLVGTTKLPPLSPGPHRLAVTYGPAAPAHPVLSLAVDAEVRSSTVQGGTLTVQLHGQGYTPLSFFAPDQPQVALDGQPLATEWDARTGQGRARALLHGPAVLTIASGEDR